MQAQVAICVFIHFILGVLVWWRATSIKRPYILKEQVEELQSFQDLTKLRIQLNTTIYLPMAEVLPLRELADDLSRASKTFQLASLEIEARVNVVEYTHCLGNQRIRSLCETRREASAALNGCLKSTDMSSFALVVLVCGDVTNRVKQSKRAQSTDERNQETLIIDGSLGWIQMAISDDLAMMVATLRTSISLLDDLYLKSINPSVKSLRHYSQQQIAREKLPLTTVSCLRLVFTLCNSDPINGFWVWNFSDFVSEWVHDTILQFRSVYSIELESQVIYDCDVNVKCQWSSEAGCCLLHESDLPCFVSSEWDVNPSAKIAYGDTAHILDLQILHFIMYIPPKNETPTFVHSAASAIRSFTLHSWGGVTILNKEYSKTGATSVPSGEPLEQKDLQAIAESVVTQLRSLLGLPEIPMDIEGLYQFDAPGVGVTASELRGLILNNIIDSVENAAGLLASVNKLVDDIPNLEIPDVIVNQVVESLTAIRNCVAWMEEGEAARALEAAKKASTLSDQAFSHPAITLKENLAEEHKLGIYLPLFLPMLLSIAMTLFTKIRIRIWK